MKKKVPVYLVSIVCAWMICLCSNSCRNNGSLPVGTQAGADSVLQPRHNEFESGRYIEALHYVDSAFHSRVEHTVYEYLSYYATHGYVNAMLGNSYLQLKYLDSAINFLRQYKNDPGLTDRLSGFLMDRGDARFNQKKYAASYEDFFEATRLARQSPDVCRKMHVPYSIGMILYRQQQFANSGKYFIESLPYVDSCEWNIAYKNNKKQEILDNIGLCYTRQKKFDSAMYYYRKALKIVEANPYKLAVDSSNSLTRQAAAMGVISGNMAKVFLGKGQPDSAIAYYQYAVKLNSGPGYDRHDMQLCLVQLSEIYLSQNKMRELHQSLQTLGASTDTMYSPDVITDFERLQFAYYEKNKEPAKALNHLVRFLHKKDSTAEQQKQLLETDISKELKDKQQQFEIELLQKDNQINHTYLLVSAGLSVLIIIILVLIYAMYRSSKKNVQNLTELNTEISSRKQTLEQALQKLENTHLEKDRILRVVAHDLRNPIGGIVTLSNMLLDGNMVDERTKPFVEAISSASASSVTMIGELLSPAYAEVKDEEKTIVDIKELLQNAVTLAKLKATEKQQHIELELPAEPVSMLIHPGQLERVVNNLLVNAIKFSQQGASIVLSLKFNLHELVIAVHDEGIGIPSLILPHIFEGASVSKRQGTAGEKSFGLGLSICRQIVEAMGGTIRAKSEEGKGSSFYVVLPV
jgi:two-component system sensor histidine kinase VicK